jgi:hypothetical protein
MRYRVFKGPMNPFTHSGKYGTGHGCMVTEGDDIAESLPQKLMDRFRSLGRDINPDLSHNPNG